MKKNHIRGAAIFFVSTLALALLMFLPRFLNFGFVYGFILLVAIIVGVLDFFGAISLTRIMQRPDDLDRPPTDLATSSGFLKLLSNFDVRIFYVGVAFFIAAACRISVIGTLGAKAPITSAIVLLILGFAAIILAWQRRRTFDGNLHFGFLVMSIATAAIMSTLGSHGLWDCWETHYGEVARRQVEQDDWISLFWENKWFYSKPILIFWLMNLGMLIFGVNVQPDQISRHAEWGIRFFVAAISLAVIAGVYSLVSKRVSRRAGLFSASVLATMPMFGFMSRQAITDLPFVGFMTLAVVFFLLGITTPKDTEVTPINVPVGGGKALQLSGFHGVIAGYITVGFSQFLYLATRNDSFAHGTLGRGDLKAAHAKEHFIPALSDYHLSDLFDVSPLVNKTFGVQPTVGADISLNWFLLGMAFLIPFAIILFTIRKERRVSRLCFHVMYLCLSLSVMAKGVAGLLMPLLGLIGYWLIATPWKKIVNPLDLVWWHLKRALRLDLVRGIPMFFLIASPWYVSMYYRHGYAFIDRFFIHDHYKRLAAGVHGGRGTFQYFVEQLGYGAFPWVALLPFALFAWPGLIPKPADRTPKERYDRTIRLFLTCWFLMSFTLLSFMTTKFHHYAFPLIPSIAILIGLFLDDVWSKKIKKLGPVVLIAVVVTIVIAKDLVVDPNVKKGVAEGYTKLLGLFIYKYDRNYPSGEAFDFGLPLLVFSTLFVFCFIGWLIKGRRRAAVMVTLIVVMAFSHFLTQHYMIQLAPNWTQRHLIDEYYAKRKSPKERLVAFQMNWKGENFYTGNRVIVRVSTKNKNFEKWVDKHRGERHFFITEYKRFKSLTDRAKAASGPLAHFRDTCNKYKAGWAEEL